MKPPPKILNENGGYLKIKSNIFILWKLGEMDNYRPLRQRRVASGKV